MKKYIVGLETNGLFSPLSVPLPQKEAENLKNKMKQITQLAPGTQMVLRPDDGKAFDDTITT